MKHLLFGAAAATLLLAFIPGCKEDQTFQPPPADTAYIKFANGEKYTFNYYDHDSSDQRVTDSKHVKTWMVLAASASIGDRTGVTKIEEVNYDGTGTTEVGARDTIYMQATSEGEIWQYDLLRSVVKRIPGGESFLDSVPAAWVKIGNTKKADSGTWNGIEAGRINNTISIAGNVISVTLAVNAIHAGKRSITVAKGTYADNFHTDHKLVITTSGAIFNSKDTFQLAYDFNAKDGLLRQALKSGTFVRTVLNAPVPGFDMELVSVTRP